MGVSVPVPVVVVWTGDVGGGVEALVTTVVGRGSCPGTIRPGAVVVEGCCTNSAGPLKGTCSGTGACCSGTLSLLDDVDWSTVVRGMPSTPGALSDAVEDVDGRWPSRPSLEIWFVNYNSN